MTCKSELNKGSPLKPTLEPNDLDSNDDVNGEDDIGNDNLVLLLLSSSVVGV